MNNEIMRSLDFSLQFYKRVVKFSKELYGKISHSNFFVVVYMSVEAKRKKKLKSCSSFVLRSRGALRRMVDICHGTCFPLSDEI